MSNFIYKLSEDSDFLIHHGIKGQKWGVENGPPYPLSPSDYSKAEKRQNKINEDLKYAKRELAISRQNNKAYNENKSDAQKLIAKMSSENAVRSSIKSLNKQIDKMPKDSKYFSKFIDDTVKEIDDLTKALDKVSIKDEKLIKAYKKYDATSTSGAIIGLTVAGAGAAAGATLATIGLMSIGVFAPGYSVIGGGMAGSLPGIGIINSNEKYAVDQLQKYLDKNQNN